MNHNTKLYFLFTFFQSFGRGIWFGNVLSAYIFFLAGENAILLGWVSAVTGLAMTLVVFPAGYLADKFRRDILLKTAGVIGAISLAFAAAATTLLLVFVALMFWGIFQGLARPSAESILADSVHSGNRSGTYAKAHALRQFSLGVGPFLNVLLFLYLGDEWELGILRSVMLVGIVCSSLSLLFLFRFDDTRSLGQEAEALVNGGAGEDSGQQKVPYLLVTANLIVGVGAGMTIKYFPIFFYEIYNFSPIGVQLMFGFLFILTGISGILAQRASLGNGRPLMIITVQGLAIACLLMIATYPPVVLLVVFFLLRGALMNAAQPLSRSILMDYIPKTNRGKWNSIEAVAWGLFWNASAAAGGYLIEAFGYSGTFMITAGIYTLGTIPIFMLIPLVVKEGRSPQVVA